jgi:transposase InsO family protein
LKDSQGKIDSLVPKSKRPKKVRQMKVSPEIISFIRDLREEHPRIGKDKIKPLLDEHCKKRGIRPISISTIGKAIKRYDLTFNPSKLNYHNPDSRWANRKKNYKSRIRHSPDYNEPGYLEIDTIVKFIYGMKLYIYNAVDLNTRFQFSYGFRSTSSKNTVEFMKKLESVFPHEGGIHTVQTDNGSEYLLEFDKYLRKKQIKHLFIYPHCPRINGYVERANRTLQEEFLNTHLDLLATNTEEFNSKLMEYLIWYNTKRVHKGLGNLSPIDFVFNPLYSCFLSAN